MASARIDLSAGRCSSSAIDRTMPAILQPFLRHDEEWDEFCNQIDEAIEPSNIANMIASGCFGVTFFSFLATWINFALSISTFSQPSLIAFPLMGILLATTVVAFLVSACVASAVEVEIRKICQETSDRHPQLSFHVRYERNYYRHNRSTTTTYIEVSINNVDVTVGRQHCGVAAAAASPAERLAELDKMKYHLMEEEYEQKRAEILASV